MTVDRVLEIDGVSKRYGETVAVDGLTFEIRAGELFGFVGRNGAGKTTTMRVVLGVLNADAGEVRWDGNPLDFEARRRIGYMPEERGLYPKMRVAEQLSYLGELHGMTGADAHSGALGWLDRFGLADRRNSELQALSLGNQQRVQLAAALVFGPNVLVLDEPFAGLDPVAVDVMAGVLRERADAGVPVIFSSHELELVERLCDRARPDADEYSGSRHRPASGNEGSRNGHLAPRRGRWEFAAEIPTPHAKSLATAATRSSRPSRGMS